jgi:hypothetical protein
MSTMIFLLVTLCSFVSGHQCFVEIYFPQHINSTPTMEATGSSETYVTTYKTTGLATQKTRVNRLLYDSRHRPCLRSNFFFSFIVLEFFISV